MYLNYMDENTSNVVYLQNVHYFIKLFVYYDILDLIIKMIKMITYFLPHGCYQEKFNVLFYPNEVLMSFSFPYLKFP